MNKYEKTSKQYVKNVDGRSMFIVTIIVDTESDIPEPQNNWLPGSICQIADTHTAKWLNNERRWV